MAPPQGKATVQHKVALICIDGWGVPSDNSPANGNAILNAKTPVMDDFAAKSSKTAQGYTELEASSLAVGLPEGLMGNSEVGHLNIGAGRVVWQDVVRIDQTIKKGEMEKVPNIVKSFARAKEGNGRLHLLGLVSDGGVHSHINHLKALLKVAKSMSVPEVYIHFFGDGRDTDPHSGKGHMQDLLAFCKELGVGQLGTVVGRYYIMDRDKRWDRVEVGLKALVLGEGEASDDPVKTIQERYDQGETDEFLKPIIVHGAAARVKDHDTLFFFNYRSDRVREVTQLLGDQDRSPKPDFPYPKDIHITTMTRYKTDFTFPVAFAPQVMDNVLADWLSKKGVKQVHIAETEKYAHVTFFFNGGREIQVRMLFRLKRRKLWETAPSMTLSMYYMHILTRYHEQFENEDRDLIPSPKVATYDKQPEMSAMAVADRMCERIASHEYEFVMNNFAPPDMVGHTVSR